uniref:Uncharacterized protein n=1 Tax=Anopheles dirus TaxID=7168 RepID=A0A182NYB3_9DIPT
MYAGHTPHAGLCWRFAVSARSCCAHFATGVALVACLWVSGYALCLVCVLVCYFVVVVVAAQLAHNFCAKFDMSTTILQFGSA